jgi:hypothetical protein
MCLLLAADAHEQPEAVVQQGLLVGRHPCVLRTPPKGDSVTLQASFAAAANI